MNNDENFCNSYKNGRDIPRKIENCPFSRLKRLKMQEQLILNHKILTSVFNDFVDTRDSIHNWKMYSKNLKKRYYEIKNLYEDFRHNVCSEEKLHSTDIEDIRKDVHHLEYTILSYKKYLQTELTILKENQDKLHNKTFKEQDDQQSLEDVKRFKIKPFTCIVSSPVKAIINTPYKNEEVQHHQDFIRKYGPWGGWNEVHHNMFLKTYQKYNSDANTADKDHIVNELLRKLSGFTSDDIIKHIDWFNKYQTLKNNQQKALNKWRANRSIMKLQRHTNNNENTTAKTAKRTNVSNGKEEKKHNSTSNETEVYVNWDNKSIKTQFKEGDIKVDCTGENNNMTEFHSQGSIQKCPKSNKKMYMQSTEQWINRCTGCSECGTMNVHLSINNTSKLMIPKWRRVLHV